MKQVLGSLVLPAAVAAYAAGCGESELASSVDCAQICNRFSDCVTEIDVTQCIDTCEVRVVRSEAVATRAALCEECIDGASCDEAVPCWDDCPVIPVLD